MTGMHTRTILGLVTLTGGLLWLVGCPDTEAVNDEFNSSWCEVPENRLDKAPSNYCSCSTDADCGREDSGKVCGPDGICQFGCHGVPASGGAGGTGGTAGSGGASAPPDPVFVPSPWGNTCPLGIECSSPDQALGKCGVSCSGAPATGADLDGLYFFTLTPGISPQPAPLAITITSGPEGITMDIQPVSADDRLTPVGSPFQRGPYPLNADGSYDANWGHVLFPGLTNPLTGSELEADIRLQGRFCADAAAEPACGNVTTGTITSPITLGIDGSPFFFEKVDAIADHTEPPFIACDGTLAPPL